MNQEWKTQVCNYIDAHQQECIELGRYFYQHPETAFREKETRAKVVQVLSELGASRMEQVAHTGLWASFDTGRPGPKAGVIAEIDALYLPEHPDANPATGAAHVCGHHMQTTALCMTAAALKETGVLSQLAGTLCLFACPAEEGNVPDELFAQLQKEEGLATPSGKQEMIRRGCFEGVSALLSTHALIQDDKVTEPALLSSGCNGFNRWAFHFHGVAAHPGMDPSKGVNALNAALLAMHALQCVRETLPLDDYSLIIPSLNTLEAPAGIIPDRALVSVTTKSKTPAILEEIDRKVQRAVQGAADCLGCGLEIKKIPGYASFLSDPELNDLYQENCKAVLGRTTPIRAHGYYSNDLGDVSAVTAVSQIVFGGFAGALHSPRFRITDEMRAYTLPAKVMACTLIDLLADK